MESEFFFQVSRLIFKGDVHSYTTHIHYFHLSSLNETYFFYYITHLNFLDNSIIFFKYLYNLSKILK